MDSHDPAFVGYEDFCGPHRETLRLWQQLGLLANSPERHPVPSCPHCHRGVPYLLGEHYLCGMCHSPVAEPYLLRWRFDLGAFLHWLARALRLQGTVRQIEERLWQLGSRLHDDFPQECFFRRTGALTSKGQNRLTAYRQVLLLHALPAAQLPEGYAVTCLWLRDLLRLHGPRV